MKHWNSPAAKWKIRKELVGSEWMVFEPNNVFPIPRATFADAVSWVDAGIRRDAMYRKLAEESHLATQDLMRAYEAGAFREPSVIRVERPRSTPTEPPC